MSTPTGSAYIESKVLTASQPQLHLILLEAAVRFGQCAAKLWNDSKEEVLLHEFLRRMLDVVEELARSTAGGDAAISGQLEEQYAFIYRELATCLFERDEKKLAECLKLLEFQRETWKLACAKLDENAGAVAPQPKPQFQQNAHVASSFSLDA